MKKIFLILCFVFISFIGFSQVKYITFTDSIKFDSGLPYPIENFSVGEISSEEGYAFTGTVNDWSNLNYYYAKLDFAGNIVSDNVISITPINSGPYPTIVAKSVSINDVTLWSNLTTINYKNQPLMLNLDIYGTYVWGKYYDIDTLEFQISGGIKSSDGGLLTFGNTSDWNLLNLGFILKTDQNGTVLWSKFYGQKLHESYPDWNGKVENLTETPDGGFLFSNGIEDPSLNKYPSITKIDANGDFQWTKTVEFLTPIDNTTEGLSSIRAILPIDNNNMLIALDVMDTLLGARKLGLLAIDPNSGSINWSKSYHLNIGDGGFNFDKIIKKSTGNFVGYYNQDMTGSVLFELDQSGGMIKTVQLRELPLVSQNNTYYNGISPTEDDGVIVSSNLLTNWPGALLFKTDKNLETYCPETEHPTFPIEDTLGFIFRTSFDTTFAVTFNEQTLSLTSPMTINQSISDPYCSCELIVYGNIDYSSTLADSVMVFLYQITETGSYVKRDSVETDVAGYYQFNYLPEGAYVVKAIPSTTKYPNYLPSYFNFSTPTTQWDSSFVLNLACGNNTIAVDISLIQKFTSTGPWQCSGYVLEFNGYNPGEKKAPGEPIPDIDITIDQSPGGSINSATTDQNGFFQFTNLSNSNATFIVRADVPGFPNDSIYTFIVNPGDGPLDSLNFYIGEDSVYILPVSILTGIDLIKSEDFDVSLKPNPTTSNFTMEINSISNSKIEIKLMNSIGEIVITKSPNINIGMNSINFEIQNQPAGIYFLSINYENQHFIKKIVKQ